jgi:enoyl-CoA hydratase/carnithine racemase
VSSCLKSTREGPILRLTLSRPEKRNALSDQMAEEFEGAIRSIGKEVRVIVIHADGPHFCAGLDLTEQRDRDPLDVVATSRRWHAIKDTLQFGRCPVVAALHGGVIGGGFELAVTAHVRIANRTAYFQLPEGKRGIFIGGGGSVRIAKVIGASRLTEIMLTGRRVSAEEAERIGVVHTLADEGRALEVAMETALTIAGNAQFVNYLIMHALPRIADMSAADGLFTESLAAGLSQVSEDARAGVDAFLMNGATPSKAGGAHKASSTTGHLQDDPTDVSSSDK